MMRFVFAIIIPALVMALWTAPPSAAEDFKITNFRSGLVCPSGGPHGGWICFEATEVPITGQGQCVYDGAPRRCTWYGFEFEYANAKAGDAVACVMNSDTLTTVGDPRGVQKQDTDRYEYSLPLETGAGRFYNPQYSVFAPEGRGPYTIVDETVCSYGGREVFRFRFELKFPN